MVASYHEELEQLPETLRAKMLKSGGLWAWRLQDIPEVAGACRNMGYAILGGQVEFFVPDGTCELYWLDADPQEKTADETWAQYVERSYYEFLKLFTAMVEKTDFEKAGIESFEFLEKKKAAGTNILDYLCFELVVTSEGSYGGGGKHFIPLNP